jgi:hypothetical protein
VPTPGAEEMTGPSDRPGPGQIDFGLTQLEHDLLTENRFLRIRLTSVSHGPEPGVYHS